MKSLTTRLACLLGLSLAPLHAATVLRTARTGLALLPWLACFLLPLLVPAVLRAATYTHPGTNITLTYTVSGTPATVTITDCNEDATGALVIPDTFDKIAVTVIGEGAFYNCRSLTSVTIPSKVADIRSIAFRDCRGLASVNIPFNVTFIGNEAFRGCSRLKSATISPSITTINKGAFQDCSGLSSLTIPANVTSIGEYAFRGCSSLTSVTIPPNVTSIGDAAFTNCISLHSVTIPANVTSIGGLAFSGCSSLTSVTIPLGVTFIGTYAFASCSSLTSVTIPATVTEIPQGIFEDCSRLTSVSISDNVTYIGFRSFRNCSGLTRVSIPDRVNSINQEAFEGCISLTSVIIPPNVTFIGSEAFSGCSRLRSAIFAGNAPRIFSTFGVFSGTAVDFKIYYSLGVSGFTAPTWQGYPAGLQTNTTPIPVLPATSISTLSFLGVSSVTLIPAFASGVTSYVANVSNVTTSVTVTPIATMNTSSIKVDEVTVPLNSSSEAIPLAEGSNYITTEVTALSGTTTSYIVNVTRDSSPSSSVIVARVLDTAGLEWSVGGNAIWYDQSSSTPTHDGIDAARSGRIESNEETWLQTTVTGPGALSFWWKVSSEPGYDYLEFYIDGVLQNGSISGEENWAQKSYPIDAGTHVLRWVYTKDSNFYAGSDSAWVDQVVWTSSDPYSGWAAGFFNATQLANPAISGDLADFDKDGVPNLLEYLFGGNPTLPSSGLLPAVTKAPGSNNVVFTYKRKIAATGVTQVIEHATSLSPPWTPAVHGAGGVTITTTPVPGDATAEQVTVTIPSTSTSRFVRLKASR